eukprot:jgi/Mesen1/4884/ME000244S04063
MAYLGGTPCRVKLVCRLVVAAVCVLASCIEHSDAAAVVDAYRMIQYDFRGSPFGSRRAGLNHHASSGLDVPGADLTRAVVVMSVNNVDLNLINGTPCRVKLVCRLVVAAVCVLASCIEHSDAAAVVDAYRMIQYDFRGSPFGSRRAGLNHHASSGLDVPGADLTRAVVVMSVNNVDLNLINEVLQGKRFIGGLLLLLPESFASTEAGDASEGEEDDDDEAAAAAAAAAAGGVDLEAISALEHLLVHSSFPSARMREACDVALVTPVRGCVAAAFARRHKLVVKATEPKKLAVVPITNVQGWLHGLRGDSDAVVPTIAIVAPYDTFGAAPVCASPPRQLFAEAVRVAQPLARGSDSSGSAVVALLEVARLFFRLYGSPKTRGRYNLLFGLTSGAPYNYDGTRQWLASFDQRVLETVEFAVCLHSIGSWGDKLRLHVSKPPKDPTIARFYEVAWEHEQFSRSRIVAGTLSGLAAPPALFQAAGGIADTRLQVREAALVKAIKIVAESLARYIYGHEGKSVEIFADGSSLGVSRPYVRHWLSLLSRTPRVAPFLPKTAPIFTALHKELGGHTDRVDMHTAPLDASFAIHFHSSQLCAPHGGAVCGWTWGGGQVASVTFDLLIMLAIGAYLSALFLILHISTKGLDDLMGVFRRPPPRKGKAL